MKIKQLGSNQTLLTTNHGWLILYSYETPVAGYNSILQTYFKTDKKWSRTTTKHINSWLKKEGVKNNIITMKQSDIDNIGFLIGDQ